MFLSNLNEKTLRNEKLSGGRKRLDEVLSIISFIAPEDADYLGKPVSQLQWSNRYNIYIVKIRHRGKHTILPEGGAVIHPGDKVFALGERRAIDTFYNLIKMRPEREIRTLRQFMPPLMNSTSYTRWPFSVSSFALMKLTLEALIPALSSAIDFALAAPI